MYTPDCPLSNDERPSSLAASVREIFVSEFSSSTSGADNNSISAKKKKKLSNEKERGQRLNKQQSFIEDIFMVDMSRRLALRKELHERL